MAEVRETETRGSRKYINLVAWQKSMDLVEKIYSVSQSFPSSELYGLTAQLRRAAVSVPSNIAEGSGRKHPKEFCQFLFHSLGSLMEIETQIFIANRIGFINQKTLDDLMSLSSEIRRILTGLISSLEKKLSIK